MRRAAIAVIFLCLSSAVSAEQYQVDLSFGTGLASGDDIFTTGNLDLVTTARHLSINGTINTDSGFSSPVTGTCFNTVSGGVYCNIQIDHFSANLSIGSNLSGAVELKNAVGTIVSRTTVTITDVR